MPSPGNILIQCGVQFKPVEADSLLTYRYLPDKWPDFLVK